MYYTFFVKNGSTKINIFELINLLSTEFDTSKLFTSTADIERGRNTKKGLLDRDSVAVRTTEDNRTFTTGEIMDLVATHTGVPSYARELVENFWKMFSHEPNYTKNKRNETELSVSVHWRFDKEWRDSSNNKHMRNRPEFKEMLENLEIYHGLLTESVLKHIQKVAVEDNMFVDRLKVYIATPTDETAFIKTACQTIKNMFEKRNSVTNQNFDRIKSVNILSSLDLENWKSEILAEKNLVGNKCGWISDLWFEVSSQMEMFLVENSDIFIDSSMVSSWSMLVIKRRSAAKKMSKYDKYVLEVINDEQAAIMNYRENITVTKFFKFHERALSFTQSRSRLFRGEEKIAV